MPEAIKINTNDGQFPVSKRDMFYKVRDMMQSLTPRELKYNYFSQDLLNQYQKLYGKIPGLFSESRGWLIEPHTGKTTRMGTREVAAYSVPLWLYNKILYVEKQGAWEKLEFGKFAERYDMAVIMGQGYAVEAVYELLQRANREHSYQVFVLHDADPDGYQIALKLRQAATDMSKYNIDVIDLGLTYDDAIQLGLTPEKFNRKKALPEGVEFSPLALEAFTGTKAGKKQWRDCKRIELNALNFPDFIAYLDSKLQQHGATDKVIPPEDYLLKEAHDYFETDILKEVQTAIDEMFNVHDLARDLNKELANNMPFGEAAKWVETAFNKNRADSWRAAVRREVSERVHEFSGRIVDAVANSVKNRE